MFDDDVIEETFDMEEENLLQQELGEFGDYQEDETEESSVDETWLLAVKAFGYDEDFLQDPEIQTLEDVYEKISYFKNEELLEVLDEEERRILELKRTGKIESIKEYLNYVEQDEKTEFNIDTEDSAREFLRNFYKEKGLKEKVIEATLNTLDLDDELLSTAKEEYDNLQKGKESLKKQREEEFLKQKEAEKKQRLDEYKDTILQINDYVSKQTWSEDTKQFVYSEVGNNLQNTITRLQTVLNNPKTAPEAIALFYNLIQEDGTINKDYFLKKSESKAVENVTKSWKKAIAKNDKVLKNTSSSNRQDDYELEMI